MIVFLLIFAINAVKYEDKEETCMTLASRSIKERDQEISQHMANHPDFVLKDFNSKIVEDSYHYCMKVITVKEVKNLGGIAQRHFSTYSHLVKQPLDKYTSLEKIQVSKDFSDFRIEVSKRIATNSMKGPNL